MIEQMIGKIARQKIGKKMAPKRKKGRDLTFFVDSLVLLCLSDLSENCVCVCLKLLLLNVEALNQVRATFRLRHRHRQKKDMPKDKAVMSIRMKDPFLYSSAEPSSSQSSAKLSSQSSGQSFFCEDRSQVH